MTCFTRPITTRIKRCDSDAQYGEYPRGTTAGNEHGERFTKDARECKRGDTITTTRRSRAYDIPILVRAITRQSVAHRSQNSFFPCGSAIGSLSFPRCLRLGLEPEAQYFGLQIAKGVDDAEQALASF